MTWQRVWRSLTLSTKNYGSRWGVGVSGNDYLSFVAKCVSNPVSCVALGESDPPRPCDPALLLCLLTHNSSQWGTCWNPTRWAVSRLTVVLRFYSWQGGCLTASSLLTLQWGGPLLTTAAIDLPHEYMWIFKKMLKRLSSTTQKQSISTSCMSCPFTLVKVLLDQA